MSLVTVEPTQLLWTSPSSAQLRISGAGLPQSRGLEYGLQTREHPHVAWNLATLPATSSCLFFLFLLSSFLTTIPCVLRYRYQGATLGDGFSLFTFTWVLGTTLRSPDFQSQLFSLLSWLSGSFVIFCVVQTQRLPMCPRHVSNLLCDPG